MDKQFEFLINNTLDEDVAINAVVKDETIWLQIADIFAECSIDYDKQAEITHEFYAMVKNKFHYAITGKTAAEVIDASTDRTKENMGLKTWKINSDFDKEMKKLLKKGGGNNE